MYTTHEVILLWQFLEIAEFTHCYNAMFFSLWQCSESTTTEFRHCYNAILFSLWQCSESAAAKFRHCYNAILFPLWQCLESATAEFRHCYNAILSIATKTEQCQGFTGQDLQFQSNILVLKKWSYTAEHCLLWSVIQMSLGRAISSLPPPLSPPVFLGATENREWLSEGGVLRLYTGQCWHGISHRVTRVFADIDKVLDSVGKGSHTILPRRSLLI